MADIPTDKISVFLGQALYQGQKDVITGAVARFGVSRQTIHKRLADMVAQGILEARGRTRGRIYSLRVMAEKVAPLPITPNRPEEHMVWQEYFAEGAAELPKNVCDICQYGFTEMFNNAVEHSEGGNVIVKYSRTYASYSMSVKDDGVGIFTKIRNGLNLASEREAVFELTKGKVTTDPKGHSGEGIFFTSRMFDRFSILSDRLFFSHLVEKNDWLVDNHASGGGSPTSGSLVDMEISVQSPRTRQEVFDRYTSNEELPTFDKTNVPVGLLCVGGQNIVSRSQAKRLLTGMDRFNVVVLDFSGVEEIGQAFADEVFRVYRGQHPGIRIGWVEANRNVEKMIHRVLNSQHPS